MWNYVKVLLFFYISDRWDGCREIYPEAYSRPGEHQNEALRENS